MRLHQIDLNLLVAFDAIHTERSLTRAAARLHLTQPTLSHALGRLRRLFGDPLFTRGPRGMVPTPFAERLAGPIHRALDALERELAGPSFDPAQLQRRFVIGLRDVLECAWLPGLAARVAREAPMVDLVVRPIRPRLLVEELTNGAVDLAAEVAIPVSAETFQRRLVEDRLVALVRRGHPALGRRRRLDLDAFLALSHVRVSSSARSLGIEDLALDRLGRRRRIAVRCHTHAAAVRIVAESDLALTVAALHLPWVADARVRAIELPFEVPPLAIQLYWHASTDGDPACRWLRDRLAEAAGATGSSTPSMETHGDVSFDPAEEDG